jgi:hypothetical protein
VTPTDRDGEHPTERALGTRWLDLIRYGRPDLGDRYGRDYNLAVKQALNRTALAAAQAGYDFARWSYLLTDPDSRLGEQARRDGNRKHRSTAALLRWLAKVWADAEEYVKHHPLATEEEITAVIAAMRAVAADAETDLTDAERRVLAAACDVATEKGTTRPALPLHNTLVPRTGLTVKRTRTALARLRDRGLLVCEVRGHSYRDGATGPDGRRIASCYRLHPERAHTPGKEGYVPSAAQGYVPPAPENPQGYVPSGTEHPFQVCGIPPVPADHGTHPAPPPHPAQEVDVITVTVSGRDAEALTARLAELLAGTGVQLGPTAPQLSVVSGGRAAEPAGPGVGGPISHQSHRRRGAP